MQHERSGNRAAGRLLALVVAAAAGCGGEDGAGPAAPAASTATDGGDAAAAAAWDTFREAFVNKAWDAAWSLFTPAAQATIEAQFDKLRREVEAGTSEYESRLRAMDIRPGDLKTLDAKGFFAKSMRHMSTAEHLRSSWEKLRADMAGSRVASVRRSGDEAVLVVRDASGKETPVGARRVGGAWRVDFQAGP